MNRIKVFIKSLFGVSVSEGTIAATIAGCAKKLKETVEAIKERVKKAPVVHCDETGMRNQGTVWWFHTTSTTLFTYLQRHTKRGSEALDEIGILTDLKGLPCMIVGSLIGHTAVFTHSVTHICCGSLSILKTPGKPGRRR